ncbi:MAG TPA: 50S ribosomal protein L21 [Thermoanaerobaculia bacterium]|nr:50S ribosomal protein L21 [Thermoanaerobaculia bacterium]
MASSATTAVIRTGGKQYRVEPGDVIDVELLGADEPREGSEVTFDDVLLVQGEGGVKTGGDLSGASVKGVLVDEVRGRKVIVYKFKRRKGYRRKNGHRQSYHRVRIDEISV